MKTYTTPLFLGIFLGTLGSTDATASCPALTPKDLVDNAQVIEQGSGKFYESKTGSSYTIAVTQFSPFMKQTNKGQVPYSKPFPKVLKESLSGKTATFDPDPNSVSSACEYNIMPPAFTNSNGTHVVPSHMVFTLK